ncbi:hypothetical protein NDU88_001864 [Pleurodeles waltl]|uniref:Uncharacterized protein n=1 Tax=Pleurodeles waltl TaxID=8319 RepID=A0AAV7LIQ9_PLEWA|nr:hypothetical protein NDU88_001864 [Pleurodeles waltl]
MGVVRQKVAQVRFAVLACAGAHGGTGGVPAAVSVVEMLPVLARVQVLVVVKGDTRPSAAASHGCPLVMMLLTGSGGAGADGSAGGGADGSVDAAGTLALSSCFLDEALLGGSCILSVLHACPFFTLEGGRISWSFALVGGALPALTGAPFDPLGLADTTADAELEAEVQAWALDTLALGEGRGEV